MIRCFAALFFAVGAAGCLAGTGAPVESPPQIVHGPPAPTSPVTLTATQMEWVIAAVKEEAVGATLTKVLAGKVRESALVLTVCGRYTTRTSESHAFFGYLYLEHELNDWAKGREMAIQHGPFHPDDAQSAEEYC